MPTLTVEQASQVLGVSVRRVRQLCKARRIKGARLVGRAWTIPIGFTVQPVRRGRPAKQR